MACRNPEVEETLAWLNTFSATSETPGAVPSILMRQGEAGACAPNPDTS